LLELVRRAQQADELVCKTKFGASPSLSGKKTGKSGRSEDSFSKKRELRKNFTKLLYKHNNVFVPASSALRSEIFKINYNNLLSDYFEVKKTHNLLIRC
jgi:hypothetical protein